MIIQASSMIALIVAAGWILTELIAPAKRDSGELMYQPETQRAPRQRR